MKRRLVSIPVYISKNRVFVEGIVSACRRGVDEVFALGNLQTSDDVRLEISDKPFGKISSKHIRAERCLTCVNRCNVFQANLFQGDLKIRYLYDLSASKISPRVLQALSDEWGVNNFFLQVTYAY